ncbi:MAG: alanine racemase [Patescibacteria group bacterium]
MRPYSWLEISESAIRHNLRIIKKSLAPRTKLSVAIKANAYGHGLIGVAKILQRSGADWLSVTSVEEAKELRQAKIKLPIIIIGAILEQDLPDIIKTRSSCFIYDHKLAQKLSQLAVLAGQTIPIHIKIDTGMGRQGLAPQAVKFFIEKISQLKNIKIEGIGTHFATSDEGKNNDYFLRQLKLFLAVADEAEKILGRKLIKHCANSAAAMLYPQANMDMVRVGLSAYGYYPSPTIKKIWEKKSPALQPCLSWKTKIVATKKIKRGTCVSYGCHFKAKTDTTIAILPIGYYDGLDRRLSNCGEVLVHDRKTKIIGTICMNLTMIDVGQIGRVRAGDEVVILGRQGREQISVEELANKIGTINYEVVTRIREGLPKIYQQKNRQKRRQKTRPKFTKK